MWLLECVLCYIQSIYQLNCIKRTKQKRCIFFGNFPGQKHLFFSLCSALFFFYYFFENSTFFYVCSSPHSRCALNFVFSYSFFMILLRRIRMHAFDHKGSMLFWIFVSILFFFLFSSLHFWCFSKAIVLLSMCSLYVCVCVIRFKIFHCMRRGISSQTITDDLSDFRVSKMIFIIIFLFLLL